MMVYSQKNINVTVSNYNDIYKLNKKIIKLYKKCNCCEDKIKIFNVFFVTHLNEFNFLSKTQMLNNEMFVLKERVPSDVAIAKDAIVFPKMRRAHLYGYCVKFKITKKGRVRII